MKLVELAIPSEARIGARVPDRLREPVAEGALGCKSGPGLYHYG